MGKINTEGYLDYTIIFSFAVSPVTRANTDNYSVKLRLTFQIPEFLPIFGKKARIYYHGMPLFCGGCHNVGHLKLDCKLDTTDWWGFIDRLKLASVPVEYFGTWINCNSSVNSAHRSAISKLPQPNLSTPQHSELSGITEEALAKALKKIITPLTCLTPKSKQKRKRDSSSDEEKNQPHPSSAKGRGKGGKPRGKGQYRPR